MAHAKGTHESWKLPADGAPRSSPSDAGQRGSRDAVARTARAPELQRSCMSSRELARIGHNPDHMRQRTRGPRGR